MRIGELSSRSHVSTRMLRYYEQHGLIQPRRLANGYRDYDEYLVYRVMRVQELVDAGIPTRIIKEILPCFDSPAAAQGLLPDPRLREVLLRQRERMTSNIEALTENRNAIDQYIRAIDAVAI